MLAKAAYCSLCSLGVVDQLEQRRRWREELEVVEGQVQGLQEELRQHARYTSSYPPSPSLDSFEF